jgi:hypothetical protein
MPRKTKDPRLIALLDKREKLQTDCERHYRKLRLNFNRLEKSRQQLARLCKRINTFEENEHE